MTNTVPVLEGELVVESRFVAGAGFRGCLSGGWGGVCCLGVLRVLGWPAGTAAPCTRYTRSNIPFLSRPAFALKRCTGSKAGLPGVERPTSYYRCGELRTGDAAPTAFSLRWLLVGIARLVRRPLAARIS